MTSRLASLQISLGRDPRLNLEKVLREIEKVEDGSLLLLPEMFFCGFDYERMEELAELSNETLGALKELSGRKGLLIGGTVPQRVEGGFQNVAFLLQDGELLGKRAKIKLFPLFGEDQHFLPGEDNPVFETRFGRVGFLVCFELRFTQMVLDLRRKGIDILLVPAQWGYERREHLKVLSKARAIELQSFLLVSDVWGEFMGTRFAGQSGVYSPWGDTLCFSEEGDTLLSVEVDLGLVRKVRERIPMD